jgi:hypothetical protein
MASPHNQRKYDSLLDLIQDLVKHAPNGLPAEKVAEQLGKAYSTLMNELNSELPNHKFGLISLIPLMNAVDSDLPAHYIAGARHGVFVKLPRGGKLVEKTERQALACVKEFGELMGEVHDALQSDSIEPHERKRIAKEGYEALQAILTLLKCIEEEA